MRATPAANRCSVFSITEAVACRGTTAQQSSGSTEPQDYTEAAKWFRLAADKGDPQAQYNLGLAYAQGQGVPQDNVNAHMWFNLATARFPDSRGRDLAVSNRDVVANKLTPEQLTQAQNLARTWRPK